MSKTPLQLDVEVLEEFFLGQSKDPSVEKWVTCMGGQGGRGRFLGQSKDPSMEKWVPDPPEGTRCVRWAWPVTPPSPP